MPTTIAVAPRTLPVARPGGLLGAALGLAGPAAAMEGARRPTVAVIPSPTCGPPVVPVVGWHPAADAGVQLQLADGSRPMNAAAPSTPVAMMAGGALLVAAGGRRLSAARRPGRRR